MTRNITAPTGRQTILLVEDDPFVVRLLKTVLDREGFAVVATNNGEQALEIFRRHALELTLMIVDIETPTISGVEFVENLPTLDPRIPVVFMSTQCERVLPSLAQKGYPLLYKPFTPSKLVESVQAAFPVG
jgi:CheY-like chemotaxis protein